MTAEAIERVYDATCANVGHELAHQTIHATPRNLPIPFERMLATAGTAGFSVGMEIGLAIAITDIAAGRMLQRWILEAIAPQNDHRDQLAAELLAVLK